jgi:hypothetical protein
MPDNAGPIERALGRVIGKLESIEDRLERADDSRALMHQEINQLVLRTTHVESDQLTIKAQLSKLQLVTDDVIVLRTKAQGAGTLGRWLIKIGIGIITVAGWLVAAKDQIIAWLYTKP